MTSPCVPLQQLHQATRLHQPSLGFGLRLRGFRRRGGTAELPRWWRTACMGEEARGCCLHQQIQKEDILQKKSSHRPLDLAVYLLYKFSCFGERVFLLCFHLFFGVEVGCREDMSHLRGTVKTARRLRQNSPMDRLAVIRTYTSVWIACVFWYGSAAVWIGPGYGSGCAFLVPDLPGGPASMRGQRALPDLKCELRISVGTPQPRNRMSE